MRVTRRNVSWFKMMAMLGASGLLGGAAAVLGATPALALGPGQVCMVNEPNGAPSAGETLGHVGWMFMIGGTDQWIAGSTDGAVSATDSRKKVWTQTGTKPYILNFFWDKGYAKFRCHSTNTSSVGAAKNMVTTRDGQGFDTLSDNCLEDTVAIFMAYDSSMDLYQGYGDGPNYYFDHLDQFGPVHTLPSN